MFVVSKVFRSQRQRKIWENCGSQFSRYNLLGVLSGVKRSSSAAGSKRRSSEARVLFKNRHWFYFNIFDYIITCSLNHIIIFHGIFTWNIIFPFFTFFKFFCAVNSFAFSAFYSFIRQSIWLISATKNTLLITNIFSCKLFAYISQLHISVYICNWYETSAITLLYNKI